MYLHEISRKHSANFSAKVRGVSPRAFAEFQQMVCAKLREISRSFLRECSRFRIFVRGVNAKKELFSWADLYIRLHTLSKLFE